MTEEQKEIDVLDNSDDPKVIFSLYIEPLIILQKNFPNAKKGEINLDNDEYHETLSILSNTYKFKYLEQ